MKFLLRDTACFPQKMGRVTAKSPTIISLSKSGLHGRFMQSKHRGTERTTQGRAAAAVTLDVGKAESNLDFNSISKPCWREMK